jgi:ketosteroid isomerase-like protein
MSAEEMAVARQATDLFIAGDLDAAWALWSEDCIGVPPSDWPEPGPFRGREQNREVFESWNLAFGADWTNHLALRDLVDLGGGRVLVEMEFKTSGVESRLPVDQELAVIDTISNGEIVRADFFMNWGEARKAAGLE